MSTTSSTDYLLGQLDAGLKALISETREMRADIVERIEQHDARDDERFKSHAVRLEMLEKKQAVDDASDAARDKIIGSHRDGRRWIVQVLTSGGIAAAVTTMANWWHR